MKKTLFIVAVIALLATCFGATFAFAQEPEVVATKPEIEGTTINVADVSNLQWVSDYSNEKIEQVDDIPRTFQGYTIQLAGVTFDLSAIEQWTPIKNFHGTMRGDSNGATVISGMKVTSAEAGAEDYMGAGLCGNIAGGAKAYFYDITIQNATVIAKGAYAGAFVGSGYTAQFENCHVIDSEITGLQYIGGIVGTTYGNITNCTVVGTTQYSTKIYVTEDSYSLLTQVGDNAGGIIGLMGEGGGKISGCKVVNVSVTAARQVGGIAGNIQYGNSVTDCKVSGCEIISSATGSCISYRASAALGGIVGEARGTSSMMTVTGNTVENTVLTKHSTTSFLDRNEYVGRIVGTLYPSSATITLADNTYPDSEWGETGN